MVITPDGDLNQCFKCSLMKTGAYPMKNFLSYCTKFCNKLGHFKNKAINELAY